MGFLCPWDSPGKNTGVGCNFLLQGIFLTQGSSLSLLHWQVDSLPLSHQGSPSFVVPMDKTNSARQNGIRFSPSSQFSPKAFNTFPAVTKSTERIQRTLESSFLLAEVREMAGSACFTLKGLQSRDDVCSPRLPYLPPFPIAITGGQLTPSLTALFRFICQGKGSRLKMKRASHLLGKSRPALPNFHPYHWGAGLEEINNKCFLTWGHPPWKS